MPAALASTGLVSSELSSSGLAAAAVAMGVIALAEMGDKSQLVALTLATRFPWPRVMAALALAAAALNLLAVTVGAALAEIVPTRTLALASGVVFVGFAVWEAVGLLRDGDAEEEVSVSNASLGAATVAFAVSELGDKTQLAAATLAARNGAVATWVGAVLGMVIADGLAVALGTGLRGRVPTTTLRWIATGGFALIGAVVLLDAL